MIWTIGNIIVISAIWLYLFPTKCFKWCACLHRLLCSNPFTRFFLYSFNYVALLKPISNLTLHYSTHRIFCRKCFLLLFWDVLHSCSIWSLFDLHHGYCTICYQFMVNCGEPQLPQRAEDGQRRLAGRMQLGMVIDNDYYPSHLRSWEQQSTPGLLKPAGGYPDVRCGRW